MYITYVIILPSGDYMDYLVLVNKDKRIPSDWEHNINLVDIVDIDGKDEKIEKETLEKFYELKEASKGFGFDIEINSAYRSVKEQEELTKEYEEEYGPEFVKNSVAVPGYSEHHTGLAVDIALRQNGEIIQENEEGTVKLEMYEQLHTIIADYGFILRFPKGKEEITGYRYEPWHIRYIKDADKAHSIMDNNLCLEEYLKNRKVLKKQLN